MIFLPVFMTRIVLVKYDDVDFESAQNWKNKPSNGRDG
jgi:hypothetical protein